MAEVKLFDELLKDLVKAISRTRADDRKAAPPTSGNPILRDLKSLFSAFQPPAALNMMILLRLGSTSKVLGCREKPPRVTIMI